MADLTSTSKLREDQADWFIIFHQQLWLVYHSAKTGLKHTTLLNCAIKRSGYKNKNRIGKSLKRITQFGLIKSLAGVNCKNCKFSANFFLQRMYKVKIFYKIFTRKQKETVSYINYIINEGVVLYPGNSLQTMHSLMVFGEVEGGNNGDCIRDWSDVSAFFSFHFLVKPLKAMTELHGGGDAHKNVVLRERGEGWVSGPYIRPLVGPPMGPRSDPLFM